MIVKAIWEFDVDHSDMDEEYVEVKGLCEDLTRRELDYCLKHNQLNADDFQFECHPELPSDWDSEMESNVEIITFENLLEQLRSNTFEEIIEEYKKGREDSVLVDCIKEQVYDDKNLYKFLEEIGAEIIDYNDGYALIKTDKNKYYEVPCADFENRFSDDLPDETVLFFELERIYDVTDSWADV